MIRPELLKHVHKVLSSHPYLALEDFAVTEVLNKSQAPCLSIIYRAKKEFFFVFHIPTSRSIPSQDSSYQGYLFACSISPGRESVQESYVAQERRQLLVEINEWLKRLHADIVSAPAIRQFEAQSAAIDQLRQHLEELSDEPISHNDVMEFRDELDQFRISITEQLKKETINSEKLKRNTEELKRDIEFLKQTLESMTKRQWGEVFFVRFRKWSQRLSPSLRPIAAGTRLVKGVLPEGMADALDKVADTADGIADVVEKISSLDGPPKE